MIQADTTVRNLCRILPLLSAVTLAGCSLGVEPWEHDLLARKDMQIISDSVESATDQHIYFSKQAASGGAAFSGGVCGCN